MLWQHRAGLGIIRSGGGLPVADEESLVTGVTPRAFAEAMADWKTPQTIRERLKNAQTLADPGKRQTL
ncbi:MAG TPA: hypothetical protein VGJ97_11880 [Anaerolineaceae bacterium]